MAEKQNYIIDKSENPLLTFLSFLITMLAWLLVIYFVVFSIFSLDFFFFHWRMATRFYHPQTMTIGVLILLCGFGFAIILNLLIYVIGLTMKRKQSKQTKSEAKFEQQNQVAPIELAQYFALTPDDIAKRQHNQMVTITKEQCIDADALAELREEHI
ncbi:putative membrane protein [Weissella uvarum]|uniref:hypothetical protein n=1 Tax=Weissella uvarum TaxID=1479233 RepID=UPI001960B694|nr:hypothetical protein [Weissella uvarum]MBM7617337.1 putative membrane protein [Weissella uvarum]MCM0595771.1 hypothetical protein [Weissella uvarum]